MRDSMISIIVPVYNTSDYLKRCLDSLIHQTYPYLEIICVDDGSSDESLNIIKQYSELDKRILWIHQENQGLSGARNTGLMYANGSYLMFVDSDDWIELDTCRCAINAAKKENADLVFWPYVKEYKKESVETHFPWNDEFVFSEEETRNLLLRRVCGLMGEELRSPESGNSFDTVWGKLYFAEKIKNIQFVDTKVIGTEDALFNLYAISKLKKTVYLDKCFSHYRKTNASSFTKKYNPYLYQSWMTLFGYMMTFIQENDLPNQYITAINNRIALSIIGLGLNTCNMESGLTEKRKQIKMILQTEQIHHALNSLAFRWLPLHWKCFFGCAKARLSMGVLLLLFVIRCIINR